MTMNGTATDMFSLTGRITLVTGGSSGIGRAIAMAFGQAGASVVVMARGEQRLHDTVDALRDVGCRAAWVSGHLDSRAEVIRVADGAVARFGEPDVIVNAAGVNLRPPMSALTEAVWDQTMALNLDAPFLLGQRFGPGMARRGFGRLIHISSQQAHRAFVDSGAYGVSKGALESLSRSQAEAWSRFAVTSNTLVPGFVPSPLNARLAGDPDQVQALAARTLIGRNGVPEDFAGPAVFLASRAANYVTGQTICVDGGFSVH